MTAREASPLRDEAPAPPVPAAYSGARNLSSSLGGSVLPPEDQHSLGQSVLLHLLPGVLATVFYVVIEAPVISLGVPPLAAFLLAIAVVVVPFELGFLLWKGRQLNGRLSLDGVVLYREPMRARDWAWLYPTLLLAGFLGFGVLAIIEPAITTTLFGWTPDWFRKLIDFDTVSQYSRTVWIGTMVAYFALNVVVGPITEELYFRGYLLPRISRYGKWAPLINTVLFSIYHFWSPWQILTRIVGVGPFVYAVWWKRNIYLGMAVHMTLNFLGVLLVTMMILGKV
jgi:membrane protease YdiL (CAAX protease family)